MTLSFCKVARTIADLYKDIFQYNGANYKGLCSFVTMSLYGITSLSDLVRSVPGTMSVSSLSEMV
ncbi:MAG: hypothetical protein HQK51_15310 [Oligoflexia bacterium]|nr:hypothetical protein [Oligoflexia bacterium]